MEIGCNVLPDVEGHLKQANHNTVQRAADIFSWQTFLALNWPAASGVRGEPKPNAPITAPGQRVWETWKEAHEIYLHDGRQPPPWEDPETFKIYLPDGSQPLSSHASQAVEEIRNACGDRKHLPRTTKVSDVVDATLQALPADGTLPVTLKDQQGRLLRYEVRLNKPLFNYIRNAELYNGLKQAAVGEIDYPLGSQLIKAAWRQIDDAERPFFHVTEACVCNGTGADGVPTNCGPMTMGLAGFHIMTKTESAPQWIWSTFEQVDNISTTHGTVRSLNNPDCPPERCPPNKQTKNFKPNQVERVNPIPSDDPDCSKSKQAVNNVAQLNLDVQKALRGYDSPFQHYELIGTQWPSPRADWAQEPSPRADVDTEFNVEPALLANTTMETFGQDTSSCMGCHAMARTLNPSRFVSADFSFTLNNAQPHPVGALCDNVEASESCSDSIFPPPKAPKTDWDREYWQEILAGFAFATRTYELTGPDDVGSKLHCSSCHLNAGGNRDAAWWVDMEKAYDYPRTNRLQSRINQCFERSMNGKAICSTKDGPEDCDNNPVMSGLITYMGWITEQYYALPPDRRSPDHQPCRGFPPFQVIGGDYDRGQRIYTQKCSFCHNSEGEGRYENDTYFRPALWGPDSFNACAGMGKIATLGAFLRWNMPYTSGGMLTTAEANDLATFIDAQCRPGKHGCSPSPKCVDSVPVPSCTTCSEFKDKPYSASTNAE